MPGDVVVELLSNGVVVRVEGDDEAWLYSTDAVRLERCR
jgi:hypothetical protein